MKLHHAGFVVADRSRVLAQLIYEKKIKEVFDPVQDAFLVLLANYSECFTELIEPASGNSPTHNFLTQNGDGFHHFCYELDRSDVLDDLVKAHRLIKVFGPVPAMLFDGREVVFYFSRNRQIVEFLLAANEDNTSPKRPNVGESAQADQK